MSSQVISVQGLSKAYRIGSREPAPDTLVGALKASLRSPFRNLRDLRRLDTLSHDADAEDLIWALRDATFEVREGEVVGIIGRNGAGKSTLLKILSRITEPTEGRVVIRGRVSSLLEVGTGFHPELTGRENIYMNGTILGMRKLEIDRKFDEIVEFSGVERFLDTPIKRYSSGMQVRLAFAVAAHLEPELLIIDEVLAVGDAEFQSKCLGKMRDVATGGRTVLFVSHNMAAVESLCSRGVMVANGRIAADCGASDAISAYMGSFKPTGDNAGCFNLLDHANRRSGSEPVATRLTLTDAEGRSRTEFSCTEQVTFNIDFDSHRQARLRFAIFICSRGQRLFMFQTQVHSRLILRDVSTGRVSCTAPTIPLVPNSYDIEVVVANSERIVDHIDSAGSITITHGDSLGTGFLPAPSQGYFIVPGSWEYTPTVDENRRDASS